MISIEYYCWRFFEELFRKRNLFKLVYTPVGLKNINLDRLASVGDVSNLGQIVDLPPNLLFLGPDFLKDKYTLLSTSIIESPHRHFIELILRNENSSVSEYNIRQNRGTLDWRHSLPSSRNCIDATMTNKEEVVKGVYKPVIVYKFCDKYYIYDGKHRAAMCSLLGKPVKCQIVDATIAFEHHWKYMFELISNKKNFSRHNMFYRNYLSQKNGK